MERRERLIAKAKRDVSGSFSPDVTVTQLLAAIDEVMMQANTVSKRLREWHGAIIPEVGHAVSDHERFCRLVAEKTYDELVKEFGGEVSMAAPMGGDTYGMVREFARHGVAQYDVKESLKTHLSTALDGFAANLKVLCGATIAARLIASAGSLKKLACLPSSTIQMLGAEKALFRHLLSGSRAPKHGYIYSHPIVARVPARDVGKASRVLADKISMCARLDYFEGGFKADSYYAALKERFLRGGT